MANAGSRLFSRTIALIAVFCVISFSAQESESTPDARWAGQEWYNPPSPEPDPKFVLLPVTAGRVLIPVPPAKCDAAIAKLANAGTVKLTRQECEALGVPFAADQLLDNAVKEKRRAMNRGLRYMELHPPDGSPYDAILKSVEQRVTQHKSEIAHWQSLKGRLAPYLVRAVAANDLDAEFYASLWQDSVTVTHRSVIKSTANDPLRQHASMGDIAPTDMVKWPVVVYLEAPPAHVYTRIHVLKLGR